MSLQTQFETEENWDIDGIEDVEIHGEALNMSEEDEIWTRTKDQVEFLLGNLATRKASNDKSIDANSEKALQKNIDGIQCEPTAEIGRKEFLCAMNKSYKNL